MSHFHRDQRYEALLDWLEHGLNLDIHHLEIASGDASFRRYFRVTHAGGCHIVMDAPPNRENTEPFIRIAELFRAVSLKVPHIYHKNSQSGFLLLEDFGSECLLAALTVENADLYYRQAFSSLLKMQAGVNILSCGLPLYDADFVERELNIFYEWFLEKWLGIGLPNALKNQVYNFLIDSALEQPQVCVHRDYHSRNLMVLPENALGLLDFQDAVIGPLSYDAVSLLRDCYIKWPQVQVLAWLEVYYQMLQSAGLANFEFAQLRRWFDLMGLQRHLKVIGIFARLHLRDEKSGYLADIPRVFEYVLEVSAEYPDLAEFRHFLQHQVLPVYRAQL